MFLWQQIHHHHHHRRRRRWFKSATVSSISRYVKRWTRNRRRYYCTCYCIVLKQSGLSYLAEQTSTSLYVPPTITSCSCSCSSRTCRAKISNPDGWLFAAIQSRYLTKPPRPTQPGHPFVGRQNEY